MRVARGPSFLVVDKRRYKDYTFQPDNCSALDTSLGAERFLATISQRLRLRCLSMRNFSDPKGPTGTERSNFRRRLWLPVPRGCLSLSLGGSCTHASIATERNRME